MHRKGGVFFVFPATRGAHLARPEEEEDEEKEEEEQVEAEHEAWSVACVFLGQRVVFAT